MIRPWFRQAAVPWKTTVTQTRASGENRVSTKLGVLPLGTDKTGTLTEGNMVARRLWTPAGEAEISGTGYGPDGGVTRAACRCTRATPLTWPAC